MNVSNFHLTKKLRFFISSFCVFSAKTNVLAAESIDNFPKKIFGMLLTLFTIKKVKILSKINDFWRISALFYLVLVVHFSKKPHFDYSKYLEGQFFA